MSILQTTFSGSDITVIAYRNSENILKNFKVEGREKSSKEDRDAILNEAISISQQISAEKEKQNLLSKPLAEERMAELNKLKESGTLEDIQKFNEALGQEIDGKWGPTSPYARDQLARTEKQKDLEDKFNIYSSSLGKDFDTTIPPNTFVLGTLHTISYSSFREKFAVRSLGMSHAKAYSRGPRTIAGTMVFHTISAPELMKLHDSISPTNHPDSATLDQLDPFNMLLLFANEYGQYSAMHVLNIDISSEGHELSIDQILTTNSLNFYATDLIPMKEVGSLFYSYEDMITGLVRDASSKKLTSSDLKRRQNNVSNFNNREDLGIADLVQQSRGLY